MFRVIVSLTILLGAPTAFAGRIETVKEVVKKMCNKELDDQAALTLVKKAFLVCTPGQEIDADSACRIKCLKENSGAVVGG